jgi:hypothetical protein
MTAKLRVSSQIRGGGPDINVTRINEIFKKGLPIRAMSVLSITPLASYLQRESG